jgi:hypothetical protein
MSAENFSLVFSLFSRREPWRPFTIELVSGARVEVNHPESLSQSEEILKCKSTTGLVCIFEVASVVRFIDATGTT